MRSLGRKLMTLLLIAVMAMPAASSPALRHSHADGDKPHQHRTALADHHTHGPRHSHSPRHHHLTNTSKTKRTHDEHASPSPVEHRHVFWFGFQASLPLPVPERSDSSRPPAGTEQWVPLITEVTLPDASQIGSRIPEVDRLAPSELTPRLPTRCDVRLRQRSAAALLCDTARRERSGVLVI